jgi:hypothetical protein
MQNEEQIQAFMMHMRTIIVSEGFVLKLPQNTAT